MAKFCPEYEGILEVPLKANEKFRSKLFTFIVTFLCDAKLNMRNKINQIISHK